MAEVVQLFNSMIGRHLSSMFPGFFRNTNVKHDHYKDFGYPDVLDFDKLYAVYKRNGIANSAVERTLSKTWQGETFLLEVERDGTQRKRDDKETALEKQIREQLRKIRFWQRIADVDRRAMVGGYSGLILRFADGRRWDEPVDGVAGLKGLVGVDPVWGKQLRVSAWHQDQTDPDNYGKPKMFEFTELPIDPSEADKKPLARDIPIHPDRVFIWSQDGTILGDSLLAPGYNDLIDLEKIKGAGGEGFWKNAKSAPVFETGDSTVTFADMAKAMGTTVEDLHKKMNEQVANYNKGFDQMLMLQGMQAKQLQVTLPSPEHFWSAPLQSFAASVQMPLKILVGNQTGERASSEDATDWSETVMARRQNYTHPRLYELVEHLVAKRVLPVKDWYVEQTDLTEASPAEKIERASKMSTINQASATADNMLTFTVEEIRAVAGYEPLSPGELDVEPEPEDTAPKPKPKDNAR
ncbi:putative portal protein [Rhizobium phage RHph_X3_2]|nr:putative portal protein [Rhizobium phage RHph_X3_2]